MLLFYIGLVVLALYKSQFAGKSFYTEEIFSRDVTDSIKGFFIWLVFLSHFSFYVTYTSVLDLSGKQINSILGQLIVACFLFYSGYGVYLAIDKKGSCYIKGLPKNRIAKTLLHFDLAVLLFLVLQLCLGKRYNIKTILQSLIGWNSLGNSNWYIFDILFLYLITWLSFTCFPTKKLIGAMMTTVLTGVFIIFLYLTRQSWWYDTILCYVMGIWFAIFKNRILGVIAKNNTTWHLCVFSSFLIFGAVYSFPSQGFIGNAVNLLVAPMFCFIIIIFLMKLRISNKPLIFCGRHLFEIYILQRIPMIALKECGLADWNTYAFFILCVVTTLLLTIVFRYITNKLDKIIF